MARTGERSGMHTELRHGNIMENVHFKPKRRWEDIIKIGLGGGGLKTGAISAPCPIAGFGTAGAEPSGATTRKLIRCY